MATLQRHPAGNLWTAATEPEPAYRHPQPEAPLVMQDGNWCLGPEAESLFRSPGVHLQQSFVDSDRRKPGKFLDWGSRVGVMGGVVERGTERSWRAAQETQQSPFELDSVFRHSPVQEKTFTWSPDSRHFSLSLSPQAGITPRGRSSSGGPAASASYGSRFWMGQEQKRGNGDVAAALDQGTDSCEFVFSSQQHFTRGETVGKKNRSNKCLLYSKCFLSLQWWHRWRGAGWAMRGSPAEVMDRRG